MEKLLEQIAQAGPEEIGQLLQAVLRRYAEVCPDWEVSVMSLEKNGDRAQQLDNIIHRLEWMKARITE